jgi:hypothetical protein
MLAAGTTTWSYFATGSYIAKAALDSSTNWASFLGGSNDDSQWVILSLWKMADYVGAHGGDTSPYLVRMIAYIRFSLSAWRLIHLVRTLLKQFTS